MEEAFNKLQKDGNNDVDHIVTWLKDTKVIDASKEQEDKARALFKDVPDQKNVDLTTFTEAVKKLAEDLKKNFEGIAKQLGESGGKLMASAMQGASQKLKDLVDK